MTLAGDIASRVKPGGHLILSGILSSQANDVLATYQPEFEFEAIAEQDGWTRLAGKKRS
jgi:ribosomal protein L11 methyltransferase